MFYGSTGAQRHSSIADARLLTPKQPEFADAGGEPRQRGPREEFVPSPGRHLLESAREIDRRVDADGLAGRPVRGLGAREPPQVSESPRSRSECRPEATSVVAYAIAVLASAAALRALITFGELAATIALAISNNR